MNKFKPGVKIERIIWNITKQGKHCVQDNLSVNAPPGVLPNPLNMCCYGKKYPNLTFFPEAVHNFSHFCLLAGQYNAVCRIFHGREVMKRAIHLDFAAL